MDKIDQKILQILAGEGRIPISDLAARVGLSVTPCRLRFERLQKEEYILGFSARLNTEKLGLDHIAFVEVRLKQTDAMTINAFNKAVSLIPEIEQCHMIASDFDYLLKVRTADINQYRRLLGEIISALPQVRSTSTHISMEAVKETVNGVCE